MANRQAVGSKMSRGVPRFVLIAVSAVVCLIVVFFAVLELWPVTPSELVVDTTGAPIERAHLEMCGRTFPTKIRASTVEANFWGGCSTGPTLVLESAGVRHSCLQGEGYNDLRLPVHETYRFENGKCRYIDERPIGKHTG